MSQLTCWLAPLQGHILYQTAVDTPLSQISSVRFVRYWSGPDSSALWVGSGEEIHALLEQHTGLSVLCGFCDSNYLAKSFSATFQLSPRAYRAAGRRSSERRGEPLRPAE